MWFKTSAVILFAPYFLFFVTRFFRSLKQWMKAITDRSIWSGMPEGETIWGVSRKWWVESAPFPMGGIGLTDQPKIGGGGGGGGQWPSRLIRFRHSWIDMISYFKSSPPVTQIKSCFLFSKQNCGAVALRIVSWVHFVQFLWEVKALQFRCEIYWPLHTVKYR